MMSRNRLFAWVAIAPMRIGVGLKNKVLDTWASARPAVMTPLATNSLVMPPGHDRLVQSDAPRFVQAVVMLLQDAPLRLQLGNAARDLVAREFAWSRTARLTLDAYDRLVRTGVAPDGQVTAPGRAR